jgi:hypothetical protein
MTEPFITRMPELLDLLRAEGWTVRYPGSAANRYAIRDLGLGRLISLFPVLGGGGRLQLNEAVVWPPLSAAVVHISKTPGLSRDAPFLFVPQPARTEADAPREGFAAEQVRELFDRPRQS